jgi:peptidoglycan/xylan/chitin deacetylase (PgdA/CDA1 family)
MSSVSATDAAAGPAGRAGTVVNLTFHGIGRTPRGLPASEAVVWLDVRRFEEILDAVAGRDDVALFFDDGNESDVEVALQALRSRGLAATFAVVAGRLGGAGFIDEAGVRELAASGMTIASHGLDHRPWRGLGEAALAAELEVSRRLLKEAAGRPVTQAVCPFGSYDRRALNALHRAGYERVFTSDGGTARRESWLQARTTLRRDHGDAALERILSGRSPARSRVARRARLTVKRWR